MRPSFYDPSKVKDVWVERAALVAEEAHRVPARPAADDRVRVAAFGIDCQIGFATPGSSLFVPGAVEDTARTIEWLYDNLGAITKCFFSLDTHRLFQIFHPAFWTDREGKAPAPFTNIGVEDVKSGRFRPSARSGATEAHALEYVERLAKAGRYVLTIWPYHTLLGGVSHALVPALMEAAMFHALVRSAPTAFEAKGEEALTENYSVLSPEVTELGGKKVGAFNDALYSELMTYDRVYVFGQAKSHCVLSTLRDMAAREPKRAHKIWILEDATSPVPPPPISPLPPELDFPRVAEKAFAELRELGMHVVKTTDPVTV